MGAIMIETLRELGKAPIGVVRSCHLLSGQPERGREIPMKPLPPTTIKFIGRACASATRSSVESHPRA